MCDAKDLEKKKLSLEIDELNEKIKVLKRPFYKHASFWFSISAALVAVVGVMGQGYLSSVKSELAELSVERASKNQKEAELLRDKAITEKELAESEKVKAERLELAAKQVLVKAKDDFKNLEKLMDYTKQELERTKANYRKEEEKAGVLEDRNKKATKLFKQLVEQMPELKRLANNSAKREDNLKLIKAIDLIINDAKNQLSPLIVKIINRSNEGTKNELVTISVTSNLPDKPFYLISVSDWSSDDFYPDANLFKDRKIHTTPTQFTLQSGRYVTYGLNDGKPIFETSIDLNSN